MVLTYIVSDPFPLSLSPPSHCFTLLPSLSPPSPHSRLDLWPGFITSILQYEDNVMLCADVSHKIMRSDTVYDTLNELHYNSRNFHEDAIKTLVGEIVLTR